MYQLEIKPSKKIFSITLSGILSKEEGVKLMTDLSSRLKTINTSQYYVIINAEDLNAGGQDSVDNIKAITGILETAAFKGYYNITPKSIIAELQVKRVVGNEIFNKITSVKSYEEVLRLLS